MVWHATLSIDYVLQAGKTLARHQHNGPLRVLQSLYPEGPSVCHTVLVHPPGGLVGGDTLDIDVVLQTGAQAVVTTPGASRFYRSDGPEAFQRTEIRLAADARLQWLPQEALAFSGCQAENRTRLHLAPGAEALGWDVCALGLPLAGQPFARGRFTQHLEFADVWLEHGRIAADDARLLESPTGLAGHRCLATLWFASGSPLTRERREMALECARAPLGDAPASGATSPHPQLVLVRVLSPVVEPAMALLREVRSQWLQHLWGQIPHQPRLWAM